MSVKIFVLGRPGSGKSTAARLVNLLFRQRGWKTEHINDYRILRKMFLADKKHVQFQPTDNNGFDAIDFSVLDSVLKKVEKYVARMYLARVDLVTIEFARNDYHEALLQFTPDFLKDAYFLFLDADIETCLYRVHERVEHANSIDDHPSFSDEIFRSYYDKDNGSYVANDLSQEFQVSKLVKVINNTGSLGDFALHVELFANEIFSQEKFVLVSAGSLRDEM